MSTLSKILIAAAVVISSGIALYFLLKPADEHTPVPSGAGLVGPPVEMQFVKSTKADKILNNATMWDALAAASKK